MRSEVDMLQSRSVIEPVVRSLEIMAASRISAAGISRRMELAKRRSAFPDLVGTESRPDKAMAHGSLAGSHHRHDADATTQAVIDETVEKYGRYLLVGTDGRSMTIRVSYRAWTPERAAAIANAHLDSYQNLQEQAQIEGGQPRQLGAYRADRRIAKAAGSRRGRGHAISARITISQERPRTAAPCRRSSPA